jgi:hypothetical protein
MQNWKCVPILLTLEKVEVVATLDNIKDVILSVMNKYPLQILTWFPSGFALDVTMIQSFKAFSLG